MEHGSDEDNDSGKFSMLLTFDEQSDGKTVITLRQMHPTKERREGAIGFGAVEYGGKHYISCPCMFQSLKNK